MTNLIKKAFKVNYTKKVGGIGSVIVKAPNEGMAIKCASQSVFTGSNFHNAIEIPFENYIKPSKQGFGGNNNI